MHLLLVNPNTSAATTDAMLAIARGAAAGDVRVTGATATFGAPLITDEAALATAGEAVLARLAGLAWRPDGVIVSAFGDPGLEAARANLSCPVTGLAEAAMAEAAGGGRAFAVATTTPGLAAAIARRAEAAGHGRLFRGVHLTAGDLHRLMADPAALEAALLEACLAAAQAGAEVVVIGGGPLATAARALAGLCPVPIVEPIPAAIRLATARARDATHA